MRICSLLIQSSSLRCGGMVPLRADSAYQRRPAAPKNFMLRSDSFIVTPLFRKEVYHMQTTNNPFTEIGAIVIAVALIAGGVVLLVLKDIDTAYATSIFILAGAIFAG